MAISHSLTMLLMCAALSTVWSVADRTSDGQRSQREPIRQATPRVSQKGFYSVDGSYPGRPCEIMTYQPFKGKTFCYPCPYGRVSMHVGSTRCMRPPQKEGKAGILVQTVLGQVPEQETQGKVSPSSQLPLTTFNLSDAFGKYSTPGFPTPYNFSSEVEWRIQCSQSSYALVLLFDIDLRIGDKLMTDNKVIVGKWPFLYAFRFKQKGDALMHLVLKNNNTDSHSKGIQGAYVCIDEDWYKKMPSFPSMIFENQYSLKKLKADPELLNGFLNVFQSYFNLWNVFMIPELEQHLTDIVINVYRGGPPSNFPF